MEHNQELSSLLLCVKFKCVFLLIRLVNENMNVRLENMLVNEIFAFFLVWDRGATESDYKIALKQIHYKNFFGGLMKQKCTTLQKLVENITVFACFLKYTSYIPS